MSIGKLNKLLKKLRITVLLLYIILTSHFIIPIINWSGNDNSSPRSLILLNNFIDDEVSLIIGKSHKFSSDNLNGRELKNVKETKVIIEKNSIYNQNELKYYLNLNYILTYLELPNLINFIPRSPPQILS